MKSHINFVLTLILAVASINFASAQMPIVNEEPIVLNRSSFDKPDFNYPQTVIANADAKLKKSISAGNGHYVVLALIQSSLAKSLISNDSLPVIIEDINRIAQIEDDKCIQSTLLLLEAKILCDYYLNNKQKIASRTTIPTLSSNVFEWNEDQFLSHITSLTVKALSESSVLKSAKITDFSDIVSISSATTHIYPTMYDFVAYQCIDIYNSCNQTRFINPFMRGSAASSTDYSQKISQIYDSLLSFHEDGSLPHIVADINLIKSSHIVTDKQAEYNKLYQAHKHSANVAPVILLLDLEPKVLYSIYTDFLKNYPKSIFASSIEKNKLQLEKRDVTLRYNYYFTSADSIKVKCEVQNANNIVIEVYPVSNTNITLQDIKKAKIKPIASHTLSVEGSIPFSHNTQISLPPLDYGRYTIVANYINKNGKKENQSSNHTLYSFIVTDITSFAVVDNQNQKRSIFAVDAITGAPLKGVIVTCTPQNSKLTPLNAFTRKDGSISASNSSYQLFNFTNANDTLYSWRYHNYFYNYNDTATHFNCNLFTDLSVYRPGDTIKVAAVCYRANPFEKCVSKHQKVKLNFVDANHDSISCIDLVTDEMGRITHNFVVPTDRMNGNFIIYVQDSASNAQIASSRVSISEYKTPTFYIEFIGKKHSYPENGNITIRGMVKTFSGIPLANTAIQCYLQKALWWGNFNNTATTTIHTDEMGMFTVTFDAASAKDNTENSICRYRLMATATDKAGETQSASSTPFFIGKSVILEWNGAYSTCINATELTTLPIKLISNEENAPDSYPCVLSLTDCNGKEVANIPFASNKPSFDFYNIASGEYSIKISLANDPSVYIDDKKIVLYRPTDKVPPVESALWIPVTEKECAQGGTVYVLLGSSFSDSHVYYTVSYLNQVIKQRWTTLKKGLRYLAFKMPKEMIAGETAIITLYNVHNGVRESHQITVFAKVHTPVASLTFESFRNRIVPGTREHWTLHLAVDGKPVANGAIIGAITDKAINAIQENKWNFYLSNLTRTTRVALTAPYSVGRNHKTFSWNTSIDKRIGKLETPSFAAPTLNLYGQNFFPKSIRIRGFGAANSMDRAQTLMYSKNSSEEMSREYDAGVSLDTKIENTMASTPLRTDKVKTALWQPLLITDAYGNAHIEFEVPDMNTTWQFKAVGYDQAMNASTIFRDIVASKPIMVSPNMPRFLRQGDDVTLMANVLNATDSTQHCDAVIELFNPFTSQVLASQSYNATIHKQNSTSLSIAYAVPDTLNALAFRIKATNGLYSDGEQVLIPVLPSASPVVESNPFYITPEDKDYTIHLPRLNSDAKITFEYCNNPVWYIATALPSINSDNHSNATSLAHSLFAHLVAKKIVNDYPAIGEAIDYWKKHPQDSVLVSMLAKNDDLKIGNLLASPWFKESETQTLRMAQMCNLLNAEITSSTTANLVDKLAELQTDDGGFTWYKYPDAKSSVYTTIYVLQVLGKIKAYDAIDNDSKLHTLIQKGVSYLDQEIINLLNDKKDKKNIKNFSEHLSFAYTRSLFPNLAMNHDVKMLYDNITRSLSLEWRKMNLSDKAFATITLVNFGKDKEAMTILESLRQFSVYKPSTGRFWDNYQDTFGRYHSKVSLTALILQAYHMLMPKAVEIDQIRQWLLLEKQATDWGNSSLAADAVFALLTTGSDWLTNNQMPVIKFNNAPIAMNRIDQILGYGKVQLDVSNISTNSITIKRNGGKPSWGAVYSQYNAPMTDVKAHATDDIAINKEVRPYNGATEYKVGDKVQIRLTIACNRNAEYVTLTDERPACIEPADQISGYRYADGIGYYLETKDSATNIFFNYLPKGTHIVTYDAYVTNIGSFHSGVATIRCQYAPQITAHSAGDIISVK